MMSDRWKLVLSSSLLLFILVPCADTLADGAKILKYARPVPGEYIVTFRDDVTRADVPVWASHITLQGRGRLLRTFRNGARGFAAELTPSEAEKVADHPLVATVEENSLGELSYSVEYYAGVNDRWHLNRIDQRTKVSQNSTYAYGWTSTGAGVDIYIVDSGVNKDHIEFAPGQVTDGANYALSDGFSPTQPCGAWINRYAGGHGTAVASLAAGQSVGVARGATIIPVKMMNCRQYPSVSNLELRIDRIGAITSLDWILGDVEPKPEPNEPPATTRRRAVVNMSFAFDATSTDPACAPTTDCRPALENNIRNLLNEDVVVVASANNQNQNLCASQTPARFGYGGIYDPGNQPTWPFVITVGGTDENDARWFCPQPECQSTVGSNFGPCVNIYAPARRIHAALIAAPNAYRDDPNYISDYQNYSPPGSTQKPYIRNTFSHLTSGTSFSAPIVAGVAARWLQMFPQMTTRQVWEQIYSSATVLPSNFDGDGVSHNDRLVYISVYN